MKFEQWLCLFLLFTCIGNSACSRAEEVSQDFAYIPGLQAWIDAPKQGSIIPLAPYKVVFHGAYETSIVAFEIHVNGEKAADIPATPSTLGVQGGETLRIGEYFWTPPAPGTYLIEVYANGDGAVSNPARVNVTVVEGELEALPIETETPTPPYQEPPLEDTPNPEKEACIFTSLVSLNCRKGPGIFYEYVDSFVKDQSAQVVAASTGGYHWYVIGPNTGVVCAVSNAPTYGYTEGNCEDQPFFTPIPTPTFTAQPTATFTPRPTATFTSRPTATFTLTPTESPLGCTVRRPGGEIVCVYPCPSGAAPGDPCRP